MIIYCDADSFEDNWIELDDRWTLRDHRELDTASGEELMALLRRKTRACHLRMETGDVLTEPAALTEDALLDADSVLIGWLGGVGYHVIGRLRTLGNVSARISSDSNGKTAPKAKKS